MRISDWSSDVCSSDLHAPVRHHLRTTRGDAELFALRGDPQMDDPLPFRLCRGGRSGWSSLAPGTYSPGCPGNTVECGIRDGNSGDPGHYDQHLPVLLASSEERRVGKNGFGTWDSGG